MYRTKKFLISAFIAMAVLTFVVSSIDASAIGIKVETIPGNPFNDCKGSGICGIRIIIILSAETAGTGKLLSADAKVNEEFLMIRFNDKLGDEFKNKDGKFIFPIPSDLTLSEKEANALGYKSLVLQKGNYQLDGSLLRIKILKSAGHNSSRSNK